MFKTVKEWLDELPEPERSRALKNSHPNNLLYESRNLHNSIDYAFTWEDSPEGFEYWDAIYERVKKGRK